MQWCGCDKLVGKFLLLRQIAPLLSSEAEILILNFSLRALFPDSLAGAITIQTATANRSLLREKETKAGWPTSTGNSLARSRKKGINLLQGEATPSQKAYLSRTLPGTGWLAGAELLFFDFSDQRRPVILVTLKMLSDQLTLQPFLQQFRPDAYRTVASLPTAIDVALNKAFVTL